MYTIDRVKNRISKLEEKTFTELKFKERDHLQEWIANNPSALGEELLIIQKEFNGFSDTKERLDLLALDKLGNIVVIENKLDDSGRDVTWQTIKYASYCSSLTKQEIIKIYQEYLGNENNAEEKLSEFFDGKEIDEINLNRGLNTQRLIMIAANFRKEVTSSVLWLLNYKIRIQCFKVTPYSLNNQLFLNVEQILPTKDTEEYSIGIANKVQEEIETQVVSQNSSNIRLKFWEKFISKCKSVNNIFSNNSPSKDSWLGSGIGTGGITLNVVITSKYCRSEIYFNRGSQEKNKDLYDFIYNMKDSIEANFGNTLEWDRMDDKVTCRIKSELKDVNCFEQDDWDKMIKYLIDSSTRMEKAFKEPIKELNKYIRSKK
jgi:hypothetical protein